MTGMVFEVKGSGTQVSRQTLRDNQKTVRLSVAGQDDEGPKRQLQSRLKNAACWRPTSRRSSGSMPA